MAEDVDSACICDTFSKRMLFWSYQYAYDYFTFSERKNSVFEECYQNPWFPQIVTRP